MSKSTPEGTNTHIHIGCCNVAPCMIREKSPSIEWLDNQIDGSALRARRLALSQPGARQPDGTVCAGVSPDTGQPMFTTNCDEPLALTFNQAAGHAAYLCTNNHQDWRVPTKAELNVLFQNRAAIGGFDTTGSSPAGWYWSSTRYSNVSAWTQRFSDGVQLGNFRDVQSALRCVRG